MKTPPSKSDGLISTYQACLKKWTLVVAGIEAGDEVALDRELDRMDPLLAKVAEDDPSLAYRVDVLMNARRRSNASTDEKRPERPPEKGRGS